MGGGNDEQSSQTTNGTVVDRDVERKQQQTTRPLVRSPFRALIQDFSPIWFTWSMNSGIIAILLHQHPYQFRGIHTLSIIFFVIDLILFSVFSILFITRLAIYRGEAYNEVTQNVTQLPLLACWAIGFLTIAPNISLNVSQAYWGGYWATLFAYILWWIGAVWTFMTLCFFLSILSRRHLIGGQSANTDKENTHNTPPPTLVIIPCVGVATVAATGGVIAAFSHHMNADLAVPLIIISFPFLGLGLVLAILLYATLFRALLETGFPPPDQITSLFVYIGPMGQTAAALQALSEGARAWFGLYNRGTFITTQSAESLSAACEILALLVLGPAVFFTIFSIYATIDCAITTKKVRWTPSWNAVIFPTATMTTSTTFFATALDSSVFRVLTSIQLVFLVAVFLVNVFFTVKGVMKGELLIVREDPRVKKQIQEGQKER